MHVELIEHLRCPASHAESHLVAASSRSSNRRILEGVLGCPVCGGEFRVEGGVARFADNVTTVRKDAPAMEEAMRIAAFLELTDAQGFVVLFGRWTVHSPHLVTLVDTPVLLVNPPPDADLAGAGTLLCGARLPIADGLARAAALDSDVLPLDQQLGCVRAGGRVLASAAVSLPAGVREIARDDRAWVAEKTAAPGGPRLVTLTRAR